MLLPEKTTWIKTALAYFFIAALLGLLLRFSVVFDLPEWFVYKNVQHAHSHVAMMGWLSATFYAFICWVFNLERPIYRRIFWVSQATVLGMLISFPIQGYAFFSISFSTIYMISSYVFIYAVLKDLQQQTAIKNLISTRFLKAALFFLAFSTLGLWAMGPIMATDLRETPLYFGAVQFFLHFQFNGWFVFMLLGLLFKVLENNDIRFGAKMADRFFGLLLVSCFLTFALVVIWAAPHTLLFLVNGIGSLFQFAAFIAFGLVLKTVINTSKQKFTQQHFSLWKIAFLCLLFKMFLQSLLAIPDLAAMSYIIRNLVIGFIHLLMLGVLSTFFFGLLSYFKINMSRLGILTFLIGIGSTEALLFGQGLLVGMKMGAIPQFYWVLALSSILLPLGISIIFYGYGATEKD